MKFKLFLSLSLLSLLWAPSSLAAFSDVPVTHPHHSAITYLELQGSINAGAEFQPDEKLTRAALFKILFLTLGIDGSNVSISSSLNDVSEEAWFAPFAELAFQHELTHFPQQNFKPEQQVSLIEALDILLKSYGLEPGIQSNSNNIRLFQDVSSQHPHYSTIFQGVNLGLLTSDPNTSLTPYKRLTRAEFANLIYDFENLESSTASSDNTIFHKSDIFSSIWNNIVENFYSTSGLEIDEEALFQAAIQGMLDTLEDSHTVYLPENEANHFTEALDGELQGIGVYLNQDDDGGITVTGFLDGSPALEKGVEVKDQIISVDGIITENLDITDVVKLIKGPAGTSVQILILRNEREISFNITRQALEINSESAEIIEGNVWYLDLDSFSSTLSANVSELLNELEAQVSKPEAMVIDLRSNGGGFVDQAIFMASLFLAQGEDLLQLDFGDNKIIHENLNEGEYQNLPLYIFINEYSASASEILALTLREKANATIIGHTSFGKGTAQTLEYYWDGSLFKFTIAEWLSAEGKSIEGRGITPDIFVDGDDPELWFEVLGDLLD